MSWTARQSVEKTSVILWNVADPNNPALLTRLTGHTDSVYALAFSPDGRTLATASADGTVILWNVADPNRPAILNRLTGQNGAVTAVAFAPDGRTLAISSQDRNVILWDLDKLKNFRNHPVQQACTLAGRGLSRDEWTRYITGLPYQSTCPP
jgi:WD40 repeat protein